MAIGCSHGDQFKFMCPICSQVHCQHWGCPKHSCEPQWLTEMREREVQELDEREDDVSSDGSTFCPVCGRVREDSKAHRLSMFIKDERVAIIPKGTPFTLAKSIAKGVPEAYLMAETIDPETERILYSVQVYPHKPRPLYEFSG